MTQSVSLCLSFPSSSSLFLFSPPDFLCGEPSATHRPLCVSPLAAGASLRISVLWDIQLLLLPRSLMCVCCCCLSVHLCASSLLLYVCEMCVLLVQLVSLLRLKYLFSGTWMWLDILLYLQIYNCVSLIARLLTSLAILFFDASNFVTISTSSDDRWGVQPRDIWIKAIRYGLFKVTLLFKLIPQLPSTQANDLLHNQPGSPEASHPASVLSRTALRLAFSYQSVITVLLRGDKRHSYKKLMGKWTDKEDVCIIWKTRKNDSWFEDLLGKLVGEAGLRGVKSWFSEEPRSPSESDSEEAGEEREDGGDEQEEEDE